MCHPSYGGFVVILRANLEVFLTLKEGAQFLVLCALCKLSRRKSAVVGHVETGASVDEHATDCPPLVGGSFVQGRLPLFIVTPVHDGRGPVDQEKLDDVLVPKPGPVVEAGLAGLVHGEE